MPSPAPAIVANRPSDLVALYDRIAPRYARHHARWLRHAGQTAQTALEAATRTLVAPGARILDAGCGTGAFARRLLAEPLPPVAVTLLDPSRRMLAQCSDLPAERRVGRLEALPFADASFDILTCAWALETVPDPARAMAEMARVLAPGGALCLAFCADRSDIDMRGRVLRMTLTLRGSGRFLSPAKVSRDLAQDHGLTVRALPCDGPAAALVAFRPLTSR